MLKLVMLAGLLLLIMIVPKATRLIPFSALMSSPPTRERRLAPRGIRKINYPLAGPAGVLPGRLPPHR